MAHKEYSPLYVIDVQLEICTDQILDEYQKQQLEISDKNKRKNTYWRNKDVKTHTIRNKEITLRVALDDRIPEMNHKYVKNRNINTVRDWALKKMFNVEYQYAAAGPIENI